MSTQEANDDIKQNGFLLHQFCFHSFRRALKSFAVYIYQYQI